ncbi:aminotransferase class V-fold PLP-dependent enzyme [Aureispira anguillae]|uniref:Aminotransferase class V-fold PLP-dependent enzyme n=1 Tax=Aureispira anguillae TaxID=2864201 RepID=A0A916DWD3_9BACT|nr:aminotransferase class V-fold PLP-dependent enzyme [Aureispira anguillae]BDS15351.1 aminotransferase class V-fold PLP-dependent enzyme [Aureispira anguillae]
MNCQKHLFNLKPDAHYLNCASKSPLLKSAEEASIKALIRGRNPMDIAPVDFFSEVENVRIAFGRIINCAASSVALIPASSYGFSSVLNNVIAKKGGNAIIMKEEFPSGYFALKRWCETNSNALTVVEPDWNLTFLGEDWNTKILEAINENTSVVLLSAIHWMTGLKFDLKAIGERCALVGAVFIVDGSQSVGALPMNVEEYQIDALVCAGYKWLFGSYSLSLLYMGDKFKNGDPIEESWMNRTNAKTFSNLTQYESEYEPDAGRYNVGQTSNFILMPILKEGLQQINQWGPSNIQNYCQQLIQPLMQYLEGLNGFSEPAAYFSNHLFALRLPKQINLELLQQNLAKNKVFISVRDQYFRVSVNVFNTEQDIHQLIKTIDQTIKNN